MSIPSFSVLCNSAIKSHVHLFFYATFPCEFGIFLLVRSFQTLQPLLVLLRVGFMLDESTVTIILSFDFLFIAFLFHREPSLSFMIPSLSVYKTLSLFHFRNALSVSLNAKDYLRITDFSKPLSIISMCIKEKQTLLDLSIWMSQR